MMLKYAFTRGERSRHDAKKKLKKIKKINKKKGRENRTTMKKLYYQKNIDY